MSQSVTNSVVFLYLSSCMVKTIINLSIMYPRECWRSSLCPSSERSCRDFMQVMPICCLKRQKQST